MRPALFSWKQTPCQPPALLQCCVRWWWWWLLQSEQGLRCCDTDMMHTDVQEQTLLPAESWTASLTLGWRRTWLTIYRHPQCPPPPPPPPPPPIMFLISCSPNKSWSIFRIVNVTVALMNPLRLITTVLTILNALTWVSLVPCHTYYVSSRGVTRWC